MEQDTTNHPMRSLGALAIVALACALNGWALWRWSTIDTRPPAWDESIHLQLAMEYKTRLANEGWSSILEPAYFNYPPFYHLCLSWALGKTPDIADTGALVNFFYLCVLILSVYAITHDLLGRWPAVTAAFLVSCYPNVVEMTRPPMIDLALTALVALSICFLLKSEGFQRPLWSLLFGIVLGLGMLTKWTALAYVLGPLLLATVQAFREGRTRWVWVSAFASIVLFAPWYVINLIPMMSRIVGVSSLPPASGLVLRKGLEWLWYPLGLVEQMGPIFFLLLIPGLVAAFFRPKLYSILVWLILPLVLFSLIRNHNIRYALPVLPAAAILMVSWIPSDYWKGFVVLDVLAATAFVFLQFLPGMAPPIHFAGLTVPLLESKPPFPVNWQHQAIIDRIEQIKSPNSTFVRVVTIANAPHFHSTSLNVSRLARKIDDFSFEGPSRERWTEFSEFVLLKTGDLGPEFTIGTIKACSDFIQNSHGWFQKVYRIVGRWPLPDGSEAILYHCEPQPERNLGADVLNISLGELDIPNITAYQVSLKAVPISAAETSVGRLKELSVQCSSVTYQGVVFDHVAIRLIRPQVNLPLFLETQRIELLSLATLDPKASIPVKTLMALLTAKARWLESPEIDLAGPSVTLKGSVHGFPLEAKALLIVKNDHLTTRMEAVKVSGISLPLIEVRALTDQSVPLAANEDRPFRINLHSINGNAQALTLNL